MLKKLLIVAFTLILILYAGVSWFFSGLIIEGNPGRYDPAEEAFRLEEAGLSNLPERQSITFDSDGVTLAGSYYEHPEGACAVILLHTHGGNRAEILTFAPLFWNLNCDILAYDMRGSGETSESYLTFGYHDRHDVSAAVNWLTQETGTPPSQIGLFGGSYGGAVALQTLEIRSDLAFVIADSTFSSLTHIMSDDGTSRYGGWTRAFIPGAFVIAGLRAQFNPFAVSTETAVSNKTTPILLIHDIADSRIQVDHAEQIFAASNPDTTVFRLNDWGGGHVSSIFNDSEQYEADVNLFLTTHAPEFGN